MSGARYSILVVDDIGINREAGMQCLAGEGWCAAKASGGEMALVLLAADCVAVVLLEIMMPGIVGLLT
jgi:CheY-like chemotaxis protein